MRPFTVEAVASTTAESLFHVLEILPVRASPMTSRFHQAVYGVFPVAVTASGKNRKVVFLSGLDGNTVETVVDQPMSFFL